MADSAVGSRRLILHILKAWLPSTFLRLHLFEVGILALSSLQFPVQSPFNNTSGLQRARV